MVFMGDMSTRSRSRLAALCTLGVVSVGATVTVGFLSGPASAATCHEKDQYGNTNYYDCGPDDPNYGTATGKPSSSPSPTSSSPTPTATASPSPDASPTSTPAPARVPTGLRVSSGSILIGQAVTATATGTPGQVVDLYDAAAPGAARIIRSATVPSSGSVSWPGLKPGTNSHFQARERGNPSVSSTLTVAVHSAVTVTATRTGVRRWNFHGVLTPHRSGVLLTVYQVAANGALSKIGTARTGTQGDWNLGHGFASNSRRTFLVRSTADAMNAAGQSARATYTIT
jgi:hypothetical protein